MRTEEKCVKFIWYKGLMRIVPYTAYFTASQSWQDYPVKPGRVVKIQFCECGHII